MKERYLVIKKLYKDYVILIKDKNNNYISFDEDKKIIHYFGIKDVNAIYLNNLEIEEKYECENFQCVFLAPSIFVDSENQIDWVKDKKQLVIRPYKIVDFINYLDTAASLYQIV